MAIKSHKAEGATWTPDTASHCWPSVAHVKGWISPGQPRRAPGVLMPLRATDVFTPAAFPTQTYIERTGVRLEQSLRDALDTQGQIVSLVGPSKSGKTVLVERVVGPDRLITITGAGIENPDQIWTRVLDWMGSPIEVEQTSTTSGKVGAEAGASGSAGFLGFANATVEAKASAEAGHERGNTSTYPRSGLTQVIREIGNSDFVVLVDDFHYMARVAQVEAAKALKEASRSGVKICTAAVRHRGDDLVRANPELRGRVQAVDLEYWSPIDLARIATVGFGALRMDVGNELVKRLVAESAGSPQLMQLLCLHTCFELGVREALTAQQAFSIPESLMESIFERASATTDFRTLVDVIDSGPRTRGMERKTYDFKDGTSGDVYRCVLKALAADPPRQSFPYEELTRRTAEVCKSAAPVGSSVVGTCLHMSKLALEKFPNERALDWDEQKQVLDLPDPYLLFYLRWSKRLDQAD
jgi:hypothetical protein